MRTLHNLLGLILVAGAGLVSCADAETTEPTTTTTRETLAAGAEFDVDADAARIPFEIHWRRGIHERGAVALDLAAQRGIVHVRADAGDLVVTTLRIPLDDVAIGRGFEREDLSLIGAELRLTEPFRCAASWSDDDLYAYCGEATATLALDGQVRAVKDNLPITFGVLTPVEVSLLVAPTAGDGLWLYVGGNGGATFRWDDTVFTTELDAQLDAWRGVVQ